MKTTLLVLSALFALTSAANDDAAAQQRFSVRSTLQKQLREGLAQLPADHSFVQLADDDMPSVAEARLQAAQMQAQLDQGVAEADQRRAQQQAQFEAAKNNDDPAAQLQGLMNAQSSLKRMTSAFS